MCFDKKKCYFLTGENSEVLDSRYFGIFLFFSDVYLESKHLKKVLKFAKQDKNHKTIILTELSLSFAT